MNFVVLPSEGVMSIDNASLELDTTSLLPAHVEILTWRGEAGSGFIEYDDRPRVVEKVADLIPYRSLVDRWIDAASRSSVPITLVQARRIKIDMVEAVYKNKRIQPYPYIYLWECTDEAIAYMSAAVAASGLYNRIDELIGRVEAALTQVVSRVNSNVAQNNSSRDAVNGWSGTMAANWAGLTFQSWLSTYGSGSSDVYPTYPHNHVFSYEVNGFSLTGTNVPGAGGFQPMSGFSDIDTSVGSGVQSTIRWQSLDAQSPLDIDAIQFRDALRAILARRQTLDIWRAWHKQALQQTPNVAAVIAHDVAAGWP